MPHHSIDGTGALFPNDRRANDRQPHATGHISIDGRRYRLAAWTRTADTGQRYMSLVAEPQLAAVDADGTITLDLTDTLAETHGLLKPDSEVDVPIDTQGLPDPALERFGDEPPF